LAGLLSDAAEWLASDSQAPGPVDRWRHYVEKSAMGGVCNHPSIILDRTAFTDELSLVYEDRGNSDAAGEGGLGLFVQKTRRVPLLASGPPRVALRGHVLVDGRLMGQPSARSGADLIAEATGLLASGTTDFFLFEDVDMTSGLWAALSSPPPPAKAVVVSEAEPVWLLRFPPRPADYWTERHSSKARWRFRRKAKQLETLLGEEVQLRCIRGASEVPDFVDSAAKVSAVSWQGRRLGRGIDGSARDRSFIGHTAELGALRAYLLGSASRPVAFAVCYQWQGHFAYQIPAYDPEFAEASPGTVLLYRILQDLAAQDVPQVVDFGPGRHEYKSRFGTESYPTATAYLAARGSVLGLLRLERQRQRWRARLHSSAHSLLGRVGVWQRLRRVYRGG
jgi:hypothetical protein